MGLQEDVTIKTPTGDLHGHLFVGRDGLPELAANEREVQGVGAYEFYRPATIPATWSVSPVSFDDGVLMGAWRMIQVVQVAIAKVERETEETPDADAAERMKTWNSHTNKR